MLVQLKKWGNSAAIRVPAAVLETLRLQLDDTVDIREEAGLIVIEPVRTPATPTLAALLAGITDDNLHAAVDTGEPRGQEAL